MIITQRIVVDGQQDQKRNRCCLAPMDYPRRQKLNAISGRMESPIPPLEIRPIEVNRQP